MARPSLGKSPRVAVSVTIDQSLYDKAVQEAQDKRISLSQYLNNLLREKLAKGRRNT